MPMCESSNIRAYQWPNEQLILTGRFLQASSSQASNSLSGMLTTLVPVLILAGAFFAAFLIFRVKYKRVYQPRTFLGTLDEQ